MTPDNAGSVGGASKPLKLEPQTSKDVQKWLTWYNDHAADKKIPIIKYIQTREMIKTFQMFCEEYRTELLKLSESSSKPSWLENSVDNVLLDYWEPILRAAEQHQSLIYLDMLSSGYSKLQQLQDEMKKRLGFAMSEVKIILYFDRSGKAKRYPFGRNYFIGIPLIDAYRGDWMALPHELGHQIYWNTKFSDDDTTLIAIPSRNFLQKEIDGAMEQLTLEPNDLARAAIRKMLEDWTEEIFADVVGVLIAGSEFVETAWVRIGRKVENDSDLFLSDGEHPFLYLLPYLRAAAMPAEKKYSVDSYFTENWKRLFGPINYTMLKSERVVDGVRADPDVRISDIRTATVAYVENIRKRLTGNLNPIKMDKLLKGPSLLDQLKTFLGSSNTAAGPNEGSTGGRKVERSPEDEQKMLRSLLKPIILENNETWTCRNLHSNSGSRSFCVTCGVAHYWWNYLPFL